MIRTLVVLGVVCMFSVSAWGGERRKLTADEVKESYTGLSIWAGFAPAYGVGYLVACRPDGTREIYWHNGAQSGGAGGTHRVDGDKVCVTYNHKGYEECYEVYQVGENRFESVLGGQVTGTYTRLR